MAIKLDLQKDYDRVNWNFPKVLLVQFGLMSSSVGFLCVYPLSLLKSWLIVGKWEHFKPSRGLRQRDPLCDKGGLKYFRIGRKATVGTRI